ncbi:hypothetical protein DEU32_101481 [Curtobacterium sp. AG1037]|nr:hypothetical protein DEU32_101481 [Curtobacterium sp. AG1037]
MKVPVVRTAAEFGITDEEASLLVTGLLEWGGPAGLTTAAALG